MKISTKLFATIGIMLLISILAQAFSIFNTMHMRQSYQGMFGTVQIGQLVQSIQYNLVGANNDERGYLLTGQAEYINELDNKRKTIETLWKQLEALPLVPEQQELIRQISEKTSSFLEMSRQVQQAYQQGDHAQANELHFEEERELRKEVNELVADLSDDMTKQILGQMDESNVELELYVTTLVIISIAAAVFGIAIGFWSHRSIVKPLRQVNVQLAEIADGEGDLTAELPVKGNDEIAQLGRSFNRLLGSLRSLVRQVSIHAEHVAGSAEELTASAEESSKAAETITETVLDAAAGSEKQLQSVAASAQTIRSLSAETAHVAIITERAVADAGHTSGLAKEGNTEIQAIVQQMNAIEQTIRSLGGTITSLRDRSRDIGQIVEVISSITSQTNLLALNAAIEAARAGQHGHGFAVVANEVRKLAEESAASATEITNLIASIQEETAQAVSSMEEGKAEVAEGLKVVYKAGDTFAQIHESVQKVCRQIEEVSTATGKINSEAAKVVDTMQVVRDVAEQATAGTQEVSAASEQQLASMEEIAASADSLAKRAEELRGLINKFKV
ncbi:methyl-accepting chemotaxis protein [Brevibacillus fulvus]|uniref:Methyl-accepting chemotaxis protein n=1 Tax=Brevibacillus fulvus TaxID=1125967 RepID=A0A939BTB0_9BACL|nr:methyl-accepting chemotaxis protein [Brevibacillus fulvus]MBM7591632.1 methyl-accepting chemotaxis protein [Brevibacillus fulvus]